MKDYYRVRAFLSKEALLSNVRLIQENIGKDVRMMAVIKSNAYGHGVPYLLPILLEEGVDAFAVATVEEGREVRSRIPALACAQGEEKKPLILVLGYSDESEYEKALEADLSLTVFTFEQAKALSETAARLGRAAKIHIKVETGMNRIGFLPDQKSLEEIVKIAALPSVVVEGAFTHFARCDEKDKKYAEKQYKIFREFTGKMEEKGIHLAVKHAANSASILEYKEPYEEKGFMARAGIILYGLYPSEEMDKEKNKLLPVMTLKSHIVHVKEVEAGAQVGYGGSFVTERKTRIATVPIGYGDGYPRHLSNTGIMLVKGHRVPVIGRVCMDQTMIDITDYEDIKLYDEVTLFGEGLSVDELAERAGTINYEVVTQLTERVERVVR